MYVFLVIRATYVFQIGSNTNDMHLNSDMLLLSKDSSSRSNNFSNKRNQIIKQVLIVILHCSSLRSSAYTLLQKPRAVRSTQFGPQQSKVSAPVLVIALVRQG